MQYKLSSFQCFLNDCANIFSRMSCLWDYWLRYDWNWKIPRSRGKHVIARFREYFLISFRIYRDLFRKRSYRKSKRRACSPLGASTCLSGNAGTNPSTPVGPCVIDTSTPPSSNQNRWEPCDLSASSWSNDGLFISTTVRASTEAPEHQRAWRWKVS